MLVSSGVGLCHGVGGNGYVFLRLFSSTGDFAFLSRAFSFARFGLAGPHVADLLSAPDCPSSLGNGRAGFACFLADLLAHITAMTKQQHKGDDAEAKQGEEAATGHRSSFPGMDF